MKKGGGHLFLAWLTLQLWSICGHSRGMPGLDQFPILSTNRTNVSPLLMETQQFLQNVLLPFMTLHYIAKPTYLFFPPYENIVTCADTSTDCLNSSFWGYAIQTALSTWTRTSLKLSQKYFREETVGKTSDWLEISIPYNKN